jgi:hypothetical protein
MNDVHFFPTLLRQLASTYHATSIDLDQCAVVQHWSGGYVTPGSEWLAFNPELARALGWEPSDCGLFAWQSNGSRMAESIWWADGIVEQTLESYDECEVGEGWVVVVSAAALSDLSTYYGRLKGVGGVTRELVTNEGPCCQTQYFEFPLG